MTKREAFFRSLAEAFPRFKLVGQLKMYDFAIKGRKSVNGNPNGRPPKKSPQEILDAVARHTKPGGKLKDALLAADAEIGIAPKHCEDRLKALYARHDWAKSKLEKSA